MAKVANPRKQFLFNIIIPGLQPFLAQEVKAADAEFDVAEHGDFGFLVKTAGLKKISTLNITKIMPAETVDLFMKNWQRQIFNTTAGGGALPSVYKRSIIIEEFSNDGISVVERTIYKGAWPMKVNGKEFSRKGSENTVESVELCIDEEI